MQNLSNTNFTLYLIWIVTTSGKCYLFRYQTTRAAFSLCKSSRTKHHVLSKSLKCWCPVYWPNTFDRSDFFLPFLSITRPHSIDNHPMMGVSEFEQVLQWCLISNWPAIGQWRPNAYYSLDLCWWPTARGGDVMSILGS